MPTAGRAEGAAAGSLFGHGPIFRDFNLSQDVGAAAKMLVTGVPAVLFSATLAAERPSPLGASFSSVTEMVKAYSTLNPPESVARTVIWWLAAVS